MRLLYLQHVDWAWIPQRPHYLAKELELLGHDVHVLHVRGWRRSGNVAHDGGLALSNPPTGLRGCPRWSRPAVRALDAFLLSRQLRRRLRQRFDAVWVTHPRIHAALKDRYPPVPVIYDCMDDAGALATSDERYVETLDRELLATARLVLASSPALAHKVEPALSRQGACHLVRNGCRDDYPWPARRAGDPAWVAPGGDAGLARPAGRQRVLFYGTIGPWLDFDVLEFLAGDEAIDLRLVGPVRAPLSPLLTARCHAAMSHTRLLDFAAEWADWLLLPFKRDRFSETVDPVKLHEYVALGKPILAPRLEVLAPAAAFVETYDSPREAAERVRLARRPTASADTRRAYVDGATWKARARDVDRLLHEVVAG